MGSRIRRLDQIQNQELGSDPGSDPRGGGSVVPRCDLGAAAPQGQSEGDILVTKAMGTTENGIPRIYPIQSGIAEPLGVSTLRNSCSSLTSLLFRELLPAPTSQLNHGMGWI